jgi:hypothetical protein
VSPVCNHRDATVCTTPAHLTFESHIPVFFTFCQRITDTKAQNVVAPYSKCIALVVSIRFNTVNVINEAPVHSRGRKI